MECTVGASRVRKVSSAQAMSLTGSYNSSPRTSLTWNLVESRRTKSSISQYTDEDTEEVPNDPKPAKDKFCRGIRTVIVILKWISSLTEKGEADGDAGRGRTFTDIASEAFTSDELRNSGLSFDLSLFKAKREVNISNEVKHILSIPSVTRTPEQIQTALYGLQHLKSFAEYPLHMQEKLCRVAWFQQVPSKRVIIRQGHFAENFYFILAGQAIVRILDKNAKTGEAQLRTATIMRKGTSFGELALLHHSRRTATVVSQETLQLLAIGRDDFFEIFMSGQGRDGIPDHIKFVSSLDFMANWPVSNLLKHPDYCLFHFFKRGVVIVKDSTQSDWLYIIKSESCLDEQEDEGLAGGGRSVSRQKQLTNKSFSLSRYDKFIRISSGRQHVTQTTPVPPKRFSSTEGNKGGSQGSRDKEITLKSRLPPDNNATSFKGPVFVQVDVLKPKDVFGLSTIQFDDEYEESQPPVSLVSNGAECIMLSRKFFVEHANALVKQRIREQTRPYPSDDTLQENLQIKVDWDHYKRSLIQHLVASGLQGKT